MTEQARVAVVESAKAGEGFSSMGPMPESRNKPAGARLPRVNSTFPIFLSDLEQDL